MALLGVELETVLSETHSLPTQTIQSICENDATPRSKNYVLNRVPFF